MERMTTKQLAKLQKALGNMRIKNCLLIIHTEDGKFFIHPKGDEEILQKLLGAYCRKHPELQYFLMGAIRRSVGADALVIEKGESAEGGGARA